MNWEYQRDISKKIKEAIEGGKTEAAAEKYIEVTRDYLESIGAAIGGYSSLTVPCVLAALKMVEEAVTKTHARLRDMELANILARSGAFGVSTVSFPCGEEKRGSDQ